jgi:hypothetical protein
VPETNRRTKLSLYCLFTFHYASVRLHLIEYDIKTLQYEKFLTRLSSSVNIFCNNLNMYVLRTEPIRFPSSGLHRNHHAAVKGGSGGNILSGTAAGELIVINETGRLFRASLPVTSNGMLSLLSIGDDVYALPLPSHARASTPVLRIKRPSIGSVVLMLNAMGRYAGSGDGCIKRLSGSDMHWQATGEALVAGKVTSLAAAVHGNYLFAGTDAGCLYAFITPSNTTPNPYSLPRSHPPSPSPPGTRSTSSR